MSTIRWFKLKWVTLDNPGRLDLIGWNALKAELRKKKFGLWTAASAPVWEFSAYPSWSPSLWISDLPSECSLNHVSQFLITNLSLSSISKKGTKMEVKEATRKWGNKKANFEVQWWKTELNSDYLWLPVLFHWSKRWGVSGKCKGKFNA